MLLTLLACGTTVSSFGQAESLTIGNYTVINSVRVGRVDTEFTVQAKITNTGAAVNSVLGTVSSTVTTTTITQNSLFFGNVDAGETKSSVNTFTIRQTRTATFNPAALRWNIVVDAPLFNVTITAPANGALTSAASVLVTGSTPVPVPSVKINGVAAAIAGSNFSANVPVAEGANTLTAVATDTLGRVATASVNITRDTEAPRLAIDSPLAGATVTADRITVTGVINDTVIGTINSQQSTITVNGLPASLANRTFIVMDVPLAPGLNTITARGTDRAGNVGTSTINVTYNNAVIARVDAVSGDRQIGRIGTLLAAPLVVLAKDENGAPAPRKDVIFKVCQNDGLVTGGGRTARSVIVPTGDDGKAQVTFQLGTRVGAGNNQVQASVVGFPGTAMFCASATPAPAALLVLDSGNRQSGAPGQPLPKPLVAIVVDSGNNRLANIPVTFTVKEGGGNFAGFSLKAVTSDSDGRALVILTLGSQEGVENNRVEATFPGNTGLPVSFVASGMVPGDPAQTSISGVVLDNSDVPVPGATISIAGTALSARSDSQGQFLIRPAPVGTVRMDVDGTTVTRPGSWVNLDFTFTTIAGQDNGIGMPVRLLEIDTAHGVGVGLNYGGTITLPDFPGFSLKLLPGSVTFPGGSKVGTVTATVVHMDKTPEVPNFGQQPRFIVSINPKRCLFNPPAQLCVPNLDGLPPGQKTEMYSFDDDLDAFVSIGTGTVSVDGTQICSDLGSGVIKGGWHCGGNPAQGGAAASLGLTVSPETVQSDIGETFEITASGTPPLDGEYLWSIDKPDVADFQTMPNCAGSSSCTAKLEAKKGGTATVTVRFRCTTTGQEVSKTVQVMICKVSFSRAPTEDATGNKYGYDELDTPDTNDDHVSIKRGDFTFVKVTFDGVADTSELFFASKDEAVVKVQDPGTVAGPTLLLKLLGQNTDKGETQVEAHIGKADGPVCAAINVNVYKEISLVGKYVRVFKDGDEAGTIPVAIPGADIESTANRFLKYPIVAVSVGAATKKGIAFDLNGNGKIDFYFNGGGTNGAGAEFDKVIADLQADGFTYTDVVLVKESFPMNWLISSTVAVGDSTIPTPGVNSLITGGNVYRLGKPDGTDAETFTITSISGTTLTIDTDPGTAGNQGFTKAHSLTADPKTSHTIVNTLAQVAGTSSDIGSGRPALLVGATAGGVGKILAHEQMHGQGLSDVNDTANVMHYQTSSNPNLLPFRFKPLGAVITGTPNPKPGSPTENQWNIPPR